MTSRNRNRNILRIPNQEKSSATNGLLHQIQSPAEQAARILEVGDIPDNATIEQVKAVAFDCAEQVQAWQKKYDRAITLITQLKAQ